MRTVGLPACFGTIFNVPRTIPVANPADALRQSAKFLAWKLKPAPSNTFVGPDGKILTAMYEMAERHYAPNELAKLWGVDTETIRNLFREEPGVVKIGNRNPKHKRAYLTLRIPESVATRVHNRLSE